MESLEPSVYYTYSRAHFGLTTYLKAHGANGYCVIHVGYFTYPHGSHLLHPLHFPTQSCFTHSAAASWLPWRVASLFKAYPSAQVLLCSLQSRTLDFTADSLSPGNLPHISLFSNPGQPPPLLTSLHLPAGRRGSHRPTQLSPAAPPPPHQAWLTQSPLMTPDGHSLLLILQPSLVSFLFLLSYLPLILLPEL